MGGQTAVSGIGVYQHIAAGRDLCGPAGKLEAAA
jgi:hypothetical protein